MKKLLLASTALLFALSSFAQCSDLFFSEYVEGTYNNKALELYNPTNAAIDLSNYRIVRWDNGNTASDADTRYVQPLTGSIAAHATWTCFLDRRNPAATAADTIMFADMLAIGNTITAVNAGNFYSPDYNATTAGARVLSFNGDDAFSIQKNINSVWTNIDIFAAIGDYPLNGTGNHTPNGAWTDTSPYDAGIGAYLTKDKTLVRKSSVKTGVSVNPTQFNALAEWDSLPVNTYSGLGSHTCDCATSGISTASSSKEVHLFPNPTAGAKEVVVYASEPVSEVSVYNMLGQYSYKALVSSLNNVRIPVAGLSKGMYIVRLQHTDGSTSLKKFSVN